MAYRRLRRAPDPPQQAAVPIIGSPDRVRIGPCSPFKDLQAGSDSAIRPKYNAPESF
jgi:hypothetical protein